MAASGTGIFYDGRTSDGHDVTVEVAGDHIMLERLGGIHTARWRLDRLYPVATPGDVLRLGFAGARTEARLEIQDAALQNALRACLKLTGRCGLTSPRTGANVVAGSLAAIAVLLCVIIWGLPLLAAQIVSHLPYTWDIAFGEFVGANARKEYGNACATGDTAQAKAARDALRKLIAPLEKAAGLPVPLKVHVVRSPVINAFALPGGHVYVLEGLLKSAESADEVAGVLGHEFGHVALRHATLHAVEEGGLHVLLGIILGDSTARSVAADAGKFAKLFYSRATEAAADDFSGQLMSKVGGDPHAMGAFLMRVAGDSGMSHLLRDHPESRDRARALARFSKPSPMKALLTPAEWNAVKTMCSVD